ncbi:carboxypeptidase-like regulatory domain-containing protein [Persicitalea sp.]|uniref:TonB-dependent receptor n=1 Tax=Persicitalea sp. TaxID=3100273 RepID=UPI003594403F
MKKIYQVLLLCLLGVSLAAPSGFAQTPTAKLISGEFQNIDFKEFVKRIEAQSDYYFYYDAIQLDPLQISMQMKNQPLAEVLRQVFNNTEYTYAIDAQNRVFVTKGKAIITALPTAGNATQTTFDYAPPTDEQEKLLSTAENKLYEIGPKKIRIAPGNSTVTGYVRSANTGEPIIGAAVYLDVPQIGVTTDVFGFYSLSIPRGKQRLRIRSVGMRETYRQIMLYSDGKLDIDMLESVTSLKEVKIKAGQDANVASSSMGQVKLSIKTLKQVPTVMGETDLLRTVMTLPGVKSVGESSVGLNVRGGSADQNLILFNDATVYNPSHLFGFFSAFNPDMLRDVELYKSTVPARFGGRLSSVLDITSRDGNKKKLVGSGGIGLITGRLTLEGPLVKDKSSFLIGARSTYSDWVLNRLKNDQYNQGKASFYDLNAHFSHEVNEKNTVYATGYMSNDFFRLFGDTTYTYQNKFASIKWKHTFNAKLFGTFTAALTDYRYAVASMRVPLNAFDLDFGIQQTSGKAEFTYLLDNRHTLEFGLSSIRYGLTPGTFQPRSSESLILPEKLEREQGQESAIYLEDNFEVNPKLLVTAGVRFSVFNYLGPKTVNQYLPGQPLDKLYEDGTTTYGSGKFIQTYGGPEFRLSARRLLAGDLSLKVSYNTLRQYIHLLSNTMVASPTDIWKLSDQYIKPQLGDQLAVGLYRNMRGNQIELSIEGYYKNIRNFLDFKGGDSLILNPRIEAATIATRGKAYGIELMVKKMSGKLNGWVAYTYSRSLLRAIDRTSSDAPNNGNYYPSNYDKPHDFTAITNYRLSHRFSVSMNFTYSTGRPYTPPIGKYTIDGAQRIYYASRNSQRIPDYLRVDLSMNIEGNHKIRKLAHSSWTVAVYNLLGRKNPSSVFFQTRGGDVNGYKLSIFGQPIPTVTYNFRF